MIWEPNESGHFKASFRTDDITVTIGADNVTRTRTSSGFWTQQLLKRPYFDLWIDLDADTTTDLGRCRHDIGIDDLHATVIRKARKWLARRLACLPSR